jgi:DNA-binding PucR family transcriptional regulator
VQRLLAGERVDPRRLGYEFGNWHVGLVVHGGEGERATMDLASRLSCQKLVVARGPELIWAWLGSMKRLAVSAVQEIAGELDLSVAIALGEPRRGIKGWRLTHYEANAGFQVMDQSSPVLVRGGDAVLLAAILRDATLAASLEESYLEPLRGRDREDRDLRHTLREYFRAGSNAATAAAALGVDRHTVKRRLHKIEERVGRSVHACHAELEMALSLADLKDSTAKNLSAMP